MGGLGLAILLLAASAPSGPGANEHILIGGRLRVVTSTAFHASPESRRFEVTLTRRNGKLIRAEACVFSDLRRDKHWDGGCFALQPSELTGRFSQADWESGHLPTVHKGAQKLLRLLAEEGESRFGGPRIVGYDPRAELGIAVSRFGEADL